jgi:hypothetical protein
MDEPPANSLAERTMVNRGDRARSAREETTVPNPPDIDLINLSPEEIARAKAMTEDPALRAMLYLLKHGVPFELAAAFTAEERAFVANAIQRITQDTEIPKRESR